MKKLNLAKLAFNIENRALSDLADKNWNGISVAVYQSGNLIYKNHFGQMTENLPVSDSTLFRLASMTKPITAVAIMKLCENGFLSLDDKVEDYLPEFKDIKVYEFKDGEIINSYIPKTKMTVRHLLSHSSGILARESYQYFHDRITSEDIKTLDNAIEFFSKSALGFEPFSATEYSGYVAFDILAKIAETVTNIPFDVYLKENIFEPLNMCDTTFAPSSEQWKRLIDLYYKENDNNVCAATADGCVFDVFPTTHILAGAGLVSSLSDYSKFALMLLNGGVYEGNRILSEDSVNQIKTYQLNKSIPNQYDRWGLGVRVITEDSPETCLPLGSFGWSGAYGTHFWVDSENEIVAVFMKNSRYDGGSGAVTANNFEFDVYNSFEN